VKIEKKKGERGWGSSSPAFMCFRALNIDKKKEGGKKKKGCAGSLPNQKGRKKRGEKANAALPCDNERTDKKGERPALQKRKKERPPTCRPSRGNPRKGRGKRRKAGLHSM